MHGAPRHRACSQNRAGGIVRAHVMTEVNARRRISAGAQARTLPQHPATRCRIRPGLWPAARTEPANILPSARQRTSASAPRARRAGPHGLVVQFDLGRSMERSARSVGARVDMVLHAWSRKACRCARLMGWYMAISAGINSSSGAADLACGTGHAIDACVTGVAARR